MALKVVVDAAEALAAAEAAAVAVAISGGEPLNPEREEMGRKMVKDRRKRPKVER